MAEARDVARVVGAHGVRPPAGDAGHVGDAGDAGARRAPLQDLAATLGHLVPTLHGLREQTVGQRQAIMDGDLSGVIVCTSEQEALGARIALLEQKRGHLQQALEDECGVRGLLAIAELPADEPARARLRALIAEVRRAVVDLQEETRQNAVLLDSAVDVAHRMRAFVTRASGATYGPPVRRAS